LDPDESRYAAIAREMAESGDWVSPRLNGTAYWEKPPLLYWSTAASIKTFGPVDGAARLPVRLSAVATAVLLLLFGGVRRAGPWAAMVFLSMPAVSVLGRVLLTDMVLCAATTLSLLLLHRILSAHAAGRRPRTLLAACGAAVGLAVLAKGLVGVAIPGLVLLAWCAILGRGRALLDVLVSPAPLVCAAVAMPWFTLMEGANPGFSWYFFVGEHLGRFAGGRVRHPGPAWTATAALLLGGLPWTPFIHLSLRPLLVRSRDALRGQEDDLWFALWPAVVVLLFTLSRSRLETYVLPAFPGVAMLTGRLFAHPGRLAPFPLILNSVLWTVATVAGAAILLWRGAAWTRGLAPWALSLAAMLAIGSWVAAAVSRREVRNGALALGVTLVSASLVTGFAFPAVARIRSTRAVAEVAARESGARVFLYECFAANLPWTLGRSVPVVGYTGEMASDGVRPAEVFVEEEEFWRHWNSGDRVLAVLRVRDRAAFLEPGRRTPRILAGDPEAPGGFVLIANDGP
jgi:4-amino-4-deoxy-L-arabinose transferase-like glycosyltransferase